jgi:site-specific DNA recombinase
MSLSHPRDFFGYIRVSTTKQGEGVSLQEQRAAIERYAAKEGLRIIQWFEEKETAAKRGRPMFGEMIRLLKAGRAFGVVIHKIDRSARNLKDWADIGELIDQGIEVRFAHEPLDLTSRGGRLSADILAVVAADFIRNNRDEAKKGFYGRLKQGLYPLGAPLGYLDGGKGGKVKEIDPVKGPLVRRALELYSTGRYSFRELRQATEDMGLWNKHGKPLSMTALTKVLNNPFYAGTIRLLKTEETFQGIHEPLIPKELFERVQRVLRKKTVVRKSKHDYLYRRLFQCSSCGLSLIASTAKGHVYYRCQTQRCPTNSVREERLTEAIQQALDAIPFDGAQLQYLESLIPKQQAIDADVRRAQIASLSHLIQFADARLTRLTDVYVMHDVPKEEFEAYRARIIESRERVKESLREVEASDSETGIPRGPVPAAILASPSEVYSLASPNLKRELIMLFTERRIVREGEPSVVAKEAPLAHESDARWYATILMQAWSASTGPIATNDALANVALEALRQLPAGGT